MDGFSGHDFRSIRAGLKMTVSAFLVAEQTHINLQGGCFLASQVQVVPRKGLGKREIPGDWVYFLPGSSI